MKLSGVELTDILLSKILLFLIFISSQLLFFALYLNKQIFQFHLLMLIMVVVIYSVFLSGGVMR